jgi:hypothetical protein
MSLPEGKNLRHAAIRRTLAQRQGQDAGTGAIAEAALVLTREVAGCLAPLIGSRGVDALVCRSLQLTVPAYPWLGLTGEHVDGMGSLPSFRSRLEVRDSRAATEASLTLLVTFTDLLATMIGASLTDRLLGPIWAPPAASPEEETAS